MANIVDPELDDFYMEECQYGAGNSEALFFKLAAMANFIKQNHFVRLPFGAQGPYSTILSFPVDGHGMSEPIPYDAEIVNVWVESGVVGSSGNTEVDIKKKVVGGSSWDTIFTTKPKFTSSSPNEAFIDSAGKIVSAPAGTTRPVLDADAALLNAGDRLRFDLLSAMPGAKDLNLKIDIRWRKSS